MGAIFLEVVELGHLRRQVLSTNPRLEIATLAAVFHAEVKMALVADASNGGQH